MKIGFTGTRKGLTSPQRSALAGQFMALGDGGRVYPAGELHHGDAIGADEQAFNMLSGRYDWKTYAHPCDIDSQRAFTTSDVVLAPKKPLIRNRDIVDTTDRLFACPGDFSEETRSGTWSTVRYARKVGRPRTIIWPDGSVTVEPSLQDSEV